MFFQPRNTIALFAPLLVALACGCTREIEIDRPPVVVALADPVLPAPALPAPSRNEPLAHPATSRFLIRPVERGDSRSLLEQDHATECAVGLLPTEQENRWLEIAWRSDLLKARREANAQRKPMFMWLMDGNPLGCT